MDSRNSGTGWLFSVIRSMRSRATLRFFPFINDTALPCGQRPEANGAHSHQCCWENHSCDLRDALDIEPARGNVCGHHDRGRAILKCPQRVRARAASDRRECLWRETLANELVFNIVGRALRLDKHEHEAVIDCVEQTWNCSCRDPLRTRRTARRPWPQRQRA